MKKTGKNIKKEPTELWGDMKIQLKCENGLLEMLKPGELKRLKKLQAKRLKKG
jgi:hypothetical protein